MAVGEHNKWAKELGYSPGEEPPEWAIDINRQLRQGDFYTDVDARSIRLRTSRAISMVPDNLRDVQSSAFTPEVVSVGPIHRGEPRLQAGEEHKKRFLVRLLKREFTRGGQQHFHEAVALKDLIQAMTLLEPQTRACYQDHSFDDIPSNDFIQMMITDGCFIIELLRLFHRFMRHERVDDPVFITSWMSTALCNDLLMLENQLPYFVLQMLFQLTSRGDEQDPSLPALSVAFFNSVWLRKSSVPKLELEEEREREYHHLLDLIRSTLLPLAGVSIRRRPYMSNLQHLIPPRPQYGVLAYTASQIQEAGIGIIKRGGHDLLDIAFENGVIKIPPLSISPTSIPVLLNFVAYEQCHEAAKPFFTNYLLFLSSLVHSSGDIKILHRKEIIRYFDSSSTDAMVDLVRLLPALSREVLHDPDLFYLKSESEKINQQCMRHALRIKEKRKEYYSTKIRGWYRNLKSTYFSSPWTILSLLAAIALLMMTALQTIYSILGYYQKS